MTWNTLGDACQPSFYFSPHLSDGRTCFGLSMPAPAGPDMCDVDNEDENRNVVDVRDDSVAERLATLMRCILSKISSSYT